MPGEVSSIEGLEEVQQMLSTAPRKIVATGFLKALEASADIIEAKLEARTPVSSVTRFDPESFRDFEDAAGGGTLKKAIVSEVTLDANFRGGTVEVGFGKMGHVANFVEHGHRMIGHKPDLKNLGNVEPHPFMSIAASDAAGPAIEAFTDTLIDELQKGGLIDVA